MLKKMAIPFLKWLNWSIPADPHAQHLGVREDNNIDTLRFALASMVLFSHSFDAALGTARFEPLKWATGQSTFGDLAVDLFFVISGFLITQSWEHRRNVVDYLKRRIGRIYPGFIAATLFGIFVVAPLAVDAGQSPPRMGWKFLLFVLLTLGYYSPAGIFPHNPVGGLLNASLWTIQYEFKCYLGVILLGLSGMIRTRRLLLAVFVATLIMCGLLAQLDRTAVFLDPLVSYPEKWARFIPLFMAGMVAYRFRDRIILSRNWALIALAGLVVFRFVPDGLSVAIPTCGCYLLLWLAFYSRIRFWRLGAHGDLSYGLYLYACPIQQLIVMRMGGHIRPLVLFILAWPLAILAGFLSWHLVEKWFLRRKRRARNENPAALAIST